MEEKQLVAEDAQKLIDILTSEGEKIVDWPENRLHFVLKQIFHLIALSGYAQPQSSTSKRRYTWEEIDNGNLYKIARDYQGIRVEDLPQIKKTQKLMLIPK